MEMYPSLPSPLSFQVLLIGTDDGKVQLTKDGGTTWTDVSSDLPNYRWVSEVHASNHDLATAYVSMNGYRFDEFASYIYKTTDYGASWTSVTGNLPEDVVNVIVQDPVNPDILYAGLDHGSYVSLNDGKDWHLITQIPNVASYDMIVHPRDLELVTATHGRSIYVSDITLFHELHGRMNEDITIFSKDDLRYSGRWGSQSVAYREAFEPDFEASFYVKPKDGTRLEIVTVQIEVTLDDERIYSTELQVKEGFNTFNWNLFNEQTQEYLQKGTYTLTINKGRSHHDASFEIK
jgi:hypothetical protein